MSDILTVGGRRRELGFPSLSASVAGEETFTSIEIEAKAHHAIKHLCLSCVFRLTAGTMSL